MKDFNQDIESPIRAEIYSIERLEEYAIYLAGKLKVSNDPKLTQPLLPRMQQNGDKLLESYRILTKAIYEKETISPGAEWLVDNFHIVEEQLREIRHDLPRQFYKELPKLGIGELTGFPRIYAIALALVAHTDSRLETQQIRRFVLSFQKITPLGIGELWAIAITLRLVLVENLRRFASHIVRDREKRSRANTLADQLIDNVGDNKEFQNLVSQIPSYCPQSILHEYAFIAQLSKRLRDQEPEHWPACECLEKHLAEKNCTTEQVVQMDHQIQASNQVTVANIITSMRLLSSLDWQEFFESVSLVDRILETDPDDSYRQMDFVTRDNYRHIIEKIAKKTKTTEIDVAKKVVQLAQEACLTNSKNRRHCHVGYYLIGRGALITENSFNKRVRAKYLAATFKHPNFIYFGLIIFLFIITAALFLYYSANHGATLTYLIAIAIIIFVPIMDLSLSVTNFILTNAVRPRRLPKMDLTSGIPSHAKTMVVIPCILASTKVIHQLLEKIEIHYLGNNDPNLFFALLTDFTDSEEQSLPDDKEHTKTAIEGIRELNQKYVAKDNHRQKQDIFFLFHRRRQWNPCEGSWMGRERKRGKLQELNRILRGAQDTSFEIVTAPKELLSQIRFVITLDADTQLPRDTAKKMIGTILHPLNQACFDRELNRVTEGYAILQPRISISLESSSMSNFAKIFSGHIGIDPYTTAVSDVYQDLFCEGSYIGKGLYDVDAFELALRDRVPENTILSHDLFEGLYARAALLTDVELLDDYPQSYEVFFKRQHRWIRGDWQIFRWMLPLVPNEKGMMVRNLLPLISRWKIFDNLRRSLVAPAILFWFILGWTVLPGSPAFWMVTGLFIIIFPSLIYVACGLITRNRGTHRTTFSAKWVEIQTNILQSFLYIVFLAHQAYISLDAIARVLYRSIISKTKLLEWVTHDQIERQNFRYLLPFWQTIWPTELLLGAITILIGQISFYSLIFAAPLFLVWMSYPLMASFLGQRLKRKQSPLSENEKQLMRQIARRTWNYFDTFVGEQDNFLPPDNFQEDPKPVIAHRTSPTNMGIYLLSLVAARDLGYISTLRFLHLLRSSLTSMQRLEKFEGHYLNWYDTKTLLPLNPKYISTVDSGNLAGYLLAIKQACHEIPDSFVVDRATFDGIRDALSILERELKKIPRYVGSLPELIYCKKLVCAPPMILFSDWQMVMKSLLESLEKVRAKLAKIRDHHDESKDVLRWTENCARQIRHVHQDLVLFVPWLNEDYSDQEKGQMLDITATLGLEQNTTFSTLFNSYEKALALEEKRNISPKFLASLQSSQANIRQVLNEAQDLEQIVNKIFEEMNFSFLMDPERGVFSIGHNIVESRHDSAVYDLLASESRLASFVAIAKGDVPQKHWYRLGRQLVPTGRQRALISWTASMFEYLMPLLVMRNYENTLLDETLHTVLLKQINYGKEHHVPWGVSEAGYNARDLQLNYQYGPFGIPGLGLKRGLSHDLVISPYSTLLAAMLSPQSTIENLKQLISHHLLTKYGFYESIDYTAERNPKKQKFVVVKSFMAHHQGMSLVAVNNVINDNIMQTRFHREPIIGATRLLLQERIPRGVPVVLPKAAEIELESEHRASLNHHYREYSNPNLSSPRVQLLSNGNYTVMISTAGSGYSKCKENAVTRWREDPTRDHWGSYIFVKDFMRDQVWSTSFQPTTQAIPDSYNVTFAEDKVEFRRRDGDITTHTEILVAPEDNVEIRHVTLMNHDTHSHILEVTSYLEPVLGPLAVDSDHPAFSKLFVHTEYLPSRNALLAKRRKRSAAEKEICGFHVVVSDKALLSSIQYETDRSFFLGRGRTLLNPKALLKGQDLSNSTGATLDPILSLRVRVELRAGEIAHIAFSTGLALSPELALELADRYHDIHSFERESKIAWTKSQVDLRHLNIDSETAYLFQRLAERILYSDPILRPPSHYLIMNANRQSNLWPYGISGDLPIVVVSIRYAKDLNMVRKLLRCHEYLRLKGLIFDLVILNEHAPTYFHGLQEDLQQQIRTTGSQALLDKPGGIYILRADITPKEHRAHIQAVARVSLFADRSLKDQIRRKMTDEKYPAAIFSRRKIHQYRIQNLSVPKLTFFNQYGGFYEEGREYVIVLGEDQWTPAPWINVIGNAHAFGFQVSETGAGFTWSVNSQANRLTTWSNDPVSDSCSEIIYLRDEESGEVWTPTPLPIRGKSNYIVRHGLGYTSFEHVSQGIHSVLTSFVPKDESIKISILKLTNLTNKARKISVTSYTEWVLGTQKQKSSPHIHSDLDPESGAIFARNPYDNEFSNRIAFADISESNRTFTCSRKEFLGRNGNYAEPAALKRQGLTRKKGTGQDPCAVLQSTLEFQPHEQRETLILLGQCENEKEARQLTLRYRNRKLAKTAFEHVTKNWMIFVNTIQVKTPEPALDVLMNNWLIYQTLTCRFWSRTAFYQSSGAYGFRDQLQDCMAFVYAAPNLTREQILRSAARQFREGDVQHWWHPPTGRGIRTRMSDDLLWLSFVVVFYVNVTGDRAILGEMIPFLEAPLLKPEQEDSYTIPEVSTLEATLFEHCVRAIDYSLSLGVHGLPLIGTGDWNDGMNRVGQHGKGESVWLGWFLYKVIQDILPFCEGQEQSSRRQHYISHLKKLKHALEAQAWDGEWYRRAYFDDGTPLGSASSEECKIDSIAQTWAILSGAGDPVRSKLAMKKVSELLVQKKSKLIMLLTPPFDKSASDPGYIKGYVPGVRENGGQYTHAAIWIVMAYAQMGDGNTAMELLNMLNPIVHTLDKTEAEKYKIEPYVLAGDVYSGNYHEGRGGWSWYTGSSSWYYRAGLESILGFHLRDRKLAIKPCIPESWKVYEIIYTYRTAKYFIKIENPHGLNQGAASIRLDGAFISGDELDLVDDAKEHIVLVTLERSALKQDWHNAMSL